VFVDGEKVDAATDITMRDCAVILSFALQYGVPADDILPALTRSHDERPLGPMGKLLELIQQQQFEFCLRGQTYYVSNSVADRDGAHGRQPLGVARQAAHPERPPTSERPRTWRTIF